MQLEEILLDKTGRELTPRGTPLFPLAMYQNDITKFPMQYVPWHWHREVELVCVRQGALRLEGSGKTVDLPSGSGAFINSNCLHAMKPLHRAACVTLNVVFGTEIIAGAAHSIFESKYVQPVLNQHQADILTLDPGQPWQADVLRTIQRAYDLHAAADLGYELELRSCLSQIWLAIFAACGRISPQADRERSARIKASLAFIHENYQAPIALADIARSAGVGVRTCCRCFQAQLQMTPFAYLNEYRVKIAAEQLLATDDTVTEICFRVGFADTSYFTRMFRRITGYTPTAFRKHAGASAHGDNQPGFR